MKKSLIVTVAVSVLLAGSVASAAATSLVGKKVAKEVQIEVDGKKTRSPAVIIDGVTYAPVREVGEMTGRTVKYEKGVVVMNSDDVTMGEDATQVKPSTQSIDNDIKYKREKLESNREEITRQEGIIADSTKRFEESLMYQKENIKFTDTESYTYSAKKIESLKAENESLEKEIAELERQKAELSVSK